MPPPLTDLRRQAGPNLCLDGPGAVAELALVDGEAGPAVQLWRQHAAAALAAVGWDGYRVAARPGKASVTLGVGSPLDGTDVACDLLAWAWARALADLGEGSAPPLAEAAAAARDAVARDADPALLDLAELARRRDLSFLHDEDHVSLGLGRGARIWPADRLPAPDEVDPDALHDMPVALVTGTNGKSTTVRLVAAIARAAGRVPGFSSSDWVAAGDEIVDRGDYSGPAGARLALRHPAVDLGVLEIARGGLMRRGLAVPRADVALITNIAADHLGDYGINDLTELAEAKFLVTRALGRGGVLVLNAEDPVLQRQSVRHGGEIAWFALSPAPVRALAAAGGRAAWLENDALTLASGGTIRGLIAVGELPVAHGGRARFNIANALAAMLVAEALGLGDEAIARGLAGFESTPEANPGRGNFIEIGGITALVDYAHNAHGVAALMDSVSGHRTGRRLALIGHAGDRTEDEIRALARAVWRAGPDRVIVKELPSKLRGRALGEVPALMLDELARLGAPDEAVEKADSEIEAVRRAFAWAREGDLLVLLTHTQRDEVLSLIQTLRREGWRAGQPLPD